MPGPEDESIGPSRIARRPTDGLDDFDRALVAELQTDGRLSNRALAAALGASEVTVANRIKRLDEAGIMRVVAVVDMEAFGGDELIVLMIRVVGAPITEVAAAVALIPEAIGVTITTGRVDLVVILLVRGRHDTARLQSMLREHIVGVDAIDIEVAVDVFKYEVRWARIEPGSDLTLDLEPHGGRDGLDVAIVEQLQIDARQSNRRIASTLDIAEGTVRLRLKRMHDDGAIRIQAISDVVAFGIGAHAYVGIEVEPGAHEAVVERLRALPQVAVLLQTLGRFDLMAVVLASTRDELVGFVVEDIAASPGVRHTETMESYRTPKHTATWVRILD